MTTPPADDLAWVAETDRLLAARDTHPLVAEHAMRMYAHLRNHVPEIRELAAEVVRLRAAADRLRGVHDPLEHAIHGAVCMECSHGPGWVAYPCATIDALAGTSAADGGEGT